MCGADKIQAFLAVDSLYLFCGSPPYQILTLPTSLSGLLKRMFTMINTTELLH